jgi:glucose-6-phosphate isomerase
VSKNKKNFIIENNINKKYFKNYLFLKDKIKLNKIINKIYSNLDNKKNTFHIFSKKIIFNFTGANLKIFTKYDSIILIGMGGSVLGAKAIYSFMSEKIKKKFIFFDNLDQIKIEQTKKKINLKDSLFIIISKSGNTIETLINSNLFIDAITYKNTIIITEPKKNLLNTFAKNKKILQINHKDYIGGRYSVLSEVGIIPAYFMGLKINNFRNNLLSFFKSKKKLILTESVIKLSHIYSIKKINSLILLSYSPQLNNFLFWLQQIVAESLGKKGMGILPVVSVAPRDHHSLLQLYLDGPKDKLFYIFSLNLKKKMTLRKGIFGKNFSFTENKNLSKVIASQQKALLETFKKKKIPYREFKINQTNEQTLGELFSYFMLETALIGELIGVNPFSQPAVEEVKTLTKKYLS